MTNLTDAPLEDRLIELMRHLGVERAHFAACMPRDWVGLLTRHKHMVASLTLMCPMGIELAPLVDGEPTADLDRHRRSRARRLRRDQRCEKDRRCALAGTRELL